MSFVHPRTDWSVLSALLRLAQREGWTPAFGNGRVRLVHRRAAEGVVVLPAALLTHARQTGWRVARRPQGFELRHLAVRHRVELRLIA
jgi:hypothetical protein